MFVCFDRNSIDGDRFFGFDSAAAELIQSQQFVTAVAVVVVVVVASVAVVVVVVASVAVVPDTVVNVVVAVYCCYLSCHCCCG